MESLAGCREEVSGSKQLGRWRITGKGVEEDKGSCV